IAGSRAAWSEWIMRVGVLADLVPVGEVEPVKLAGAIDRAMVLQTRIDVSSVGGEIGRPSVLSAREVSLAHGREAHQIHRRPARIGDAEAADAAHSAFGDLMLQHALGVARIVLQRGGGPIRAVEDDLIVDGAPTRAAGQTENPRLAKRNDEPGSVARIGQVLE